MTELRIRKQESPGDWWHIWPETCNVPEGAIEEDEDYEFELTGVESPNETSLLIGGKTLQPLRNPDNSTARWKWSPGFYSGLVRIEIGFGNVERARAEIQIDPDVAKLTRDRYNLMVEEILEDTTALFSLGPYRTGIGRGDHHELPPIARLEYLWSSLNRIVDVINQIDRSPVRILKSRERSVSHHEVRKVTGKELANSLRSGSILEETRDPPLLPEDLDGVYPSTIQKQSVETGLDIQEHREIKSALVTWKDWLLSVANRLDAVVDDSELGHRRSRWVSRCRMMANQLDDLLRLPLFEAVAELSDTPTISSIYRQKPHYRKFFHLYQEIEQGLSSITGDSLDIPISRTFDLYELWCFIRIARALAEDPQLEEPDVSNLFRNVGEGGLSLAAGSVTLHYGEDLVLAYQNGFGEYWRQEDNVGSISRLMRPDITLMQVNDDMSQEIVCLDAKYRVETDLNESLSSVHTYRDAIVEERIMGDVDRIVSGSFLLSPHDPESVPDWQEASLPDLLFDDGYRTEFSIGAASLRPGMNLTEIRRTIETLCNEADMQFPHRSKH
jgi:hypothetical protein